MPRTLGFLPYVPSTETKITPVVQPFLDVYHSWVTPAPASGPAPASSSFQPPKPPDSPPEAVNGSGGAQETVRRYLENAQISVLSRCRVRIFRNGNLGRANDWAVVITELPEQPNDDVGCSRVSAWLTLSRTARVNPGADPRPHLDQLATEIKWLHLAPFPAGEIVWFFHQRLTLFGADVVYRIHFAVVKFEKQAFHHLARGRGESPSAARFPDIYFGFRLEHEHARAELDLAAGGMVAL